MNLVNLKFDHGDYGLLPNNTFLQQPPVVNDFLPYKVISGAVLMRPDISTLTDKGNMQNFIYVICNAKILGSEF